MSADLEPLSDNENSPDRLWAEIHLLRMAVKGPEGYATWQDAAVAERMRRIEAERDLAIARAEEVKPMSVCQRIAAWFTPRR